MSGELGGVSADDDTLDDGPLPYVLTDQAETLLGLDEQVKASEPLVPCTLFRARDANPILPPPLDEAQLTGTVEAPAMFFLVGPAAGGES